MSRNPEEIGLTDNAALRRADLARVRLGPTPFETGIKYYIAKKEPELTPSTIIEDSRKLRYFARVFSQLKKAGVIDTADPRHFTQRHIEEFLVWMKSRKLARDAQAKYLQILDRYLSVFGNLIIVEIRRTKRIRLPRESSAGAIDALTHKELQAVFDAADRMPGWRGSVLRGYMAMAFATACRPKELMAAMVQDVDMERHAFYVRSPKGNGSWAEPQTVSIIRADMWPRIEQFLDERRKILGDRTCPFLFMNAMTLKPYTLNGMHMIKNDVERISGVNFQIKVFRATYASLTLEGNLGAIKAVSLQLRHASVAMTERYYARIDRNKEVQAALGEMWKNNPIE